MRGQNRDEETGRAGAEVRTRGSATAVNAHAAGIHLLQQAAGNHSVAWLLGAGATPVVQRCGAERCGDECAGHDGVGTVRDAPAVQREGDAGAPDAGPSDAGKPAADAGAGGSSIIYLTVRDPSIGLGGQVVPDLAALKARIKARQQAGDWTLVIAIHGSLNRLAAQAPPDFSKDAVYYGEPEIKGLFGGDPDFVKWRDAFGPRKVVLLGCQVGATFEQVVADNLSRGGSGLRAQGLGEHCKPITSTQIVSWGETGKEKPVKTRADYSHYSDADKAGIVDELRKLNEKWGYLGMPPVSNGDLLRFYFDEEPKGAWALVEVHKDVNGTLTPLGVPYWNRMANSTFLQSCSMGVGTLRPRATP